MMYSFILRVVLLALSLTLLCSCTNEEAYEDIAVNEAYNLIIPANFPDVKQDVSRIKLTQNGIALGRKLFYDNRLSVDNTISCAFCHEQQYAFTHHGHQFSHGINNLEGIRNAPAIQNLIFQDEYFFDGASNSIEMLSIVPIHNPVEMNESLSNIVEKLKQDVVCQKLFHSVYNSKEITSDKILNALAQFLSIIISGDSKYDKYIRNEGVSLTVDEQKGLQLFKTHCASCHSTDLFTDHSFRNNGLPINSRLNDTGRYNVTGFDHDKYKFKVPSLRNIALTAPYMHDGRFGSLESVLNFYTDGVKETQNLDPLMKNNEVLGIPLNNEEKKFIIIFLQTLTDNRFITNKNYYHQT